MGNQDKQKRRDILAGRVSSAEGFEERQDGKASARTDMNYGKVEGIEGRTIGGSGGGGGTGDPSGDFDRLGTEGNPAVNDYVDHHLEEDAIISNDATEEDYDDYNKDDEGDSVPGDIKRGDAHSGFPLGGAARDGSTDPV